MRWLAQFSINTVGNADETFDSLVGKKENNAKYGGLEKRMVLIDE